MALPLVLGVLSWCLTALLFVRARRAYRGPAGRASLLNPFCALGICELHGSRRAAHTAFFDLLNPFHGLRCKRHGRGAIKR